MLRPLVLILSLVPVVAHTEDISFAFHGRHATQGSTIRDCETISIPDQFAQMITGLEALTATELPEIQVKSCKNGMFAAESVSISGFEISRIYVPDAIDLSDKRAVAAFAHELAHIYQFQKFGSRSTVIEAHGGNVRNVELAADFAAGYLLFELGIVQNYEVTPELLGDFYPELADHHGTPKDRTDAYRLGRFFQTRTSSAFSFDSAVKYFLEFDLW